MALTKKEKDYLRKKAHNLDPIVRIGKENLNDNIIKSIDEVIAKRELIKVKVLQNSTIEDIKNLAFDISKKTQSSVVNQIGRTIVLLKVRKKDSKIKEELKGLKRRVK